MGGGIMSGWASPVVVLARRDVRQLGDAPKPFTLISGWAAQYHDGWDGERQILGIMLPGDTWHGTSSFGIVAINECHVTYSIPDEAEGSEDGALDDLATVQSLLVALGNNDAAGRVAFVLHNLFARLNRLGVVVDRTATIPLTQADIGSICCVTPVHVNRVLRTFDKAGIIRREGKRITILQAGDLARLARTDRAQPQSHYPSGDGKAELLTKR